MCNDTIVNKYLMLTWLKNCWMFVENCCVNISTEWNSFNSQTKIRIWIKTNKQSEWKYLFCYGICRDLMDGMGTRECTVLWKRSGRICIGRITSTSSSQAGPPPKNSRPRARFRLPLFHHRTCSASPCNCWKGRWPYLTHWSILSIVEPG